MAFKEYSQDIPQGVAYSDDDEDEIHLLDLVIVLLQYKRLIGGIVMLVAFSTAIYTLTLPNIYKSEATITPKAEDKGSSLSNLGMFSGMATEFLGIGGGGSLQKFEVVLKSRELTDRIIKKYHLMPILFPEEKQKKMKTPPSIQDGWKAMQDMLKIRPDNEKNTLTIGIEHEYPYLAQKLVDIYLRELSEMLREEVLRGAEQNINYFDRQIKEISDALLRDKVSSLMAREIEKQTFARAQKYFSFEILDPPYLPDLNKKVKPKRAIICILAVFVGFFIAVFTAFFIKFIQNIKTSDPERYQQILDELSFWKR